MAREPHRARDLALLDAIDAFKRTPFVQPVWRVVREGRDPVTGSPSVSRWSNGTFDELYTSLERGGALAEIHTFLALQPVFPSKLRFYLHELHVRASKSLHLADLATLANLGVDVANYSGREYGRTQDIADAAYFLGFDGLIAPSARWACLNAVLFTGRLMPDDIEITASEPEMIDWADWRKTARK